MRPDNSAKIISFHKTRTFNLAQNIVLHCMFASAYVKKSDLLLLFFKEYSYFQCSTKLDKYFMNLKFDHEIPLMRTHTLSRSYLWHS